MLLEPVRQGDIVDVVAPASQCSKAELNSAIKELKNLGLVPRVPKNIFAKSLLFSNSDEVRLKHLKNALYARDSKMIWCARGGYGSIRLMSEIEKWKRPVRPKIFLGYSDITTLHVHLNQKWHWPAYHGPLLDRLGRGVMSPGERRQLMGLIFGLAGEFEFPNLVPMNKAARNKKRIKGHVVGGNFTTLQSSLGTPSEFRPRKSILFLEDTGERAHRVDRMLTQASQAGWFDQIQAVVFGHFQLFKAKDRRHLWSDVMARFAEESSFPVYRGLKVGHDTKVQIHFAVQHSCLNFGRAETFVDREFGNWAAMNAFEKRLANKFPGREELQAITPGVVVDVFVKGKRKGLVRVGETYKYYDLASLTKIIFTASQSMIYFSEFKSELDIQLKSVLPWWKNTTTPAQLLSHTAGLEWWLPMYKRLKGPMNPDARWAQMKKQLAKVKGARRAKAVYSDIDLWMMGAFLENQLELSLLEMWEALRERFSVPNIVFHPGNRPKHSRRLYAPTEKYSYRKTPLQGEVHDENTWALAGVAPHAGLFGDIQSVSKWGLQLREALLGRSEVFGESSMVRYFTGRRIPRSRGDWGLGFMKPSRPRASCGKYFSVNSFGHTGFTGTSFWFDPKRDLMVTILSNRVHPTRDNKAFLELRPQIHNWVVESL